MPQINSSLCSILHLHEKGTEIVLIGRQRQCSVYVDPSSISPLRSPLDSVAFSFISYMIRPCQCFHYDLEYFNAWMRCCPVQTALLPLRGRRPGMIIRCATTIQVCHRVQTKFTGMKMHAMLLMPQKLYLEICYITLRNWARLPIVSLSGQPCQQILLLSMQY